MVGIIQFLFKFMHDFGLCLFSICAAEASTVRQVVETKVLNIHVVFLYDIVNYIKRKNMCFVFIIGYLLLLLLTIYS